VASAEAPVRILCIGDSYTVGEGIARRGSWPHQLARVLGEAGYGVSVRVAGATGMTTGELLESAATSELLPAYDLVTVQAGVNDQYRGRPLREFATDIAELLSMAAAAAGGRPQRVLVVSIPDWSRTPHDSGRDRAAISAAVDRFNATARQAADRIGAAWVDVTEVSRRTGDAPGMLADDGLHPSAEQYRCWLESIRPAVEEILSR
jgi:lysophospholipase L1-like esterase